MYMEYKNGKSHRMMLEKETEKKRKTLLCWCFVTRGEPPAKWH